MDKLAEAVFGGTANYTLQEITSLALEFEMEISELRETITQREDRIYELVLQIEELKAELAKLV